jgi:hypothetical protein
MLLSMLLIGCGPKQPLLKQVNINYSECDHIKETCLQHDNDPRLCLVKYERCKECIHKNRYNLFKKVIHRADTVWGALTFNPFAISKY